MTRRTLKSRLVPVLALGAGAPLVLGLAAGPAGASPTVPDTEGAAASPVETREVMERYIYTGGTGEFTNDQNLRHDPTISAEVIAKSVTTTVAEPTGQETACDGDLILPSATEPVSCTVYDKNGDPTSTYWAYASNYPSADSDYYLFFVESDKLPDATEAALNDGHGNTVSLYPIVDETEPELPTVISADVALERANYVLDHEDRPYRVIAVAGDMDRSSPTPVAAVVQDQETGDTSTAQLLPMQGDGEPDALLVSVDGA